MTEIPKKETLTIEFKSDKKCLSDSDIVDAIVGLANTEGGFLYLGIEDDGSVTGLHNNHNDILKMSVLLSNKTVPSVSVRIGVITIEETSVMVFEVSKSHSIIATSNGKVLKRKLKANGEPENIPMFPYEYNSRLSQLGNLDFSKQTLLDATLDDFDIGEIKRLRKVIELGNGDRYLLELNDTDLFKALNMVVDINGSIFPTVTGLLLVGKEESIAKYLPTAQAAFQVFEGTNIRVNEIFHKSLIAVFDYFNQIMKAWNPEREIEYDFLRVPIPEFDRRAYREALINAFSHRDYTILQMTRVLIDDEGLTISNPGAFIDGISLKNLISADPHGRNPSLADALKRIGLAERTGRGIDRIYEGSIVYGRPLPDYSESDETKVKVFIARGLPDIPFFRMLKEEQEKTGNLFSINQLMVLYLLRRNKKLSLSGILELMNITENKLQTILQQLLQRGVIQTIEDGINKIFMLNLKNASAYNQLEVLSDNIKKDKLSYSKSIVQLATNKGYITIKDICETLNITKRQARYILQNMIEKGEMYKEGTTRNTVYKLLKISK